MLKNLILICGLACLYSCQKGETKKSTTKETTTREELSPKSDKIREGFYSSGCQEDMAGSFIDTFEFRNGELEITNISFFEKGCITGQERDRFRSTYHYSLEGDFLALERRQYFYVFYTPDEEEFYNEGDGYCQKSDWRDGQEKEITGLNCDGDIFKVGERFKTPASAYDSKIIIAGKIYLLQ